ncbi:MAG: hypothetical protein ACYC6H_11660, partial [Bellilinea sp.]
MHANYNGQQAKVKPGGHPQPNPDACIYQSPRHFDMLHAGGRPAKQRDPFPLSGAAQRIGSGLGVAAKGGSRVGGIDGIGVAT